MVFFAGLVISSFQNCGSFESSLVGLDTTFNADSIADLDDIPYIQEGSAPYTTLSKTIGETSGTVSTISWDLSSEAQLGDGIDGGILNIDIQKREMSNGRGEVYYISNPVIMSGGSAIIVQSLRVVINGEVDSQALDFADIDQTVAANSVVQLSQKTAVYSLNVYAKPTDTIAISFATLFASNITLPDNSGLVPGADEPDMTGGGTSEPTNPTTPAEPADPVEDPSAELFLGAQIYSNNCAGCHGSLSNSNVRGVLVNNITGAFRSVPSMTRFQGQFSSPELEALSAALRQ